MPTAAPWKVASSDARRCPGALTEPFDAYVRREFEPLVRKASAEG
ncbi:hypothetical protein ACFY7B_29415 [Streptomyces albidoflavus]